MNRTFTFKILLFISFSIFALSNLQSQIFSDDFSDPQLTGWTTVQKDDSPITATSNWQQTFVGPQGPTPTAPPPIQSTTNTNGWMIFDSDLDCSLLTQDVWLISPLIDCSSFDSVVVKFESHYRSFNDEISIQVSTDNMENWKQFLVYPNINANEFGGLIDGSENPVEVIIDVTDTAAFKSDVRIAFRFHSEEGVTNNAGVNLFGCAYNWQIDDLEVLNFNPSPKHDLRANRNFFAISPSAMTPKSQTIPLGFLCDIENTGQRKVTDAKLQICIKDSDGTVLHLDSLKYDSIQAGMLIENQSFDATWTPPMEEESYTGLYSVSIAEEDDRLQNNEIPFDFMVTDSVFSKELGNSTVGFSPFEAVQTDVWTAANHYYVPKGDGLVCSSVLFGIANASEVEGSTVNVFLFEWDNQFNDFVVNANERNIIGFASHTIQEDDQDVIVVLSDFDDPSEQLIKLKDDTHYILAVETATNTPGIPIQITNGQQKYLAMIFWHIGSEMLLFGSFSNNSEIGEDANYTIENFSAKIRMHINEEITSVKNQLSKIHKTKVYPIPSNDIVNIDLDFQSTFDKVDIVVNDISGKTVLHQQLEGIKKETLEIDVANFANGVYTVQINTQEGLRTERFVVSE